MKKIYLVLIVLLMLLDGAAAYDKGRHDGGQEAKQTLELLQSLNRSSIEKLNVDEGPIYVIGHLSPDSDTVCSAIAFADFLKQLGYDAIPAITMPVNHETAYILERAGAEVPQELPDASGLNIFLVDHSEYAQAVPGLQDAHIVGVIDHHGVGTLQSGNQVFYEAKPIGATATIIWLEHLNYGLEIDKQKATLLLGAVLSDTGYLGGSTTTEADAQAVQALAELAQIDDIDGYYRRIHEEALSYEGMTAEEILFSDYKEYEAGGTKYGIGLVSAIDEEIAEDLARRIKEVMPEAIKKEDVDLLYVSVGIRENGMKIDRIVVGDERSESVLINAFPNYDEYTGTSYVYRTGMGRKTIMVPGLNDYLNAHPHE